MKAIITSYLGPTNTLGTRLKAKEPDGKWVCVPWRHDLEPEENHRRAAQALCKKMNWTGKFVTGWTRDGYVHVFTE